MFGDCQQLASLFAVFEDSQRRHPQNGASSIMANSAEASATPRPPREKRPRQRRGSRSPRLRLLVRRRRVLLEQRRGLLTSRLEELAKSEDVGNTLRLMVLSLAQRLERTLGRLVDLAEEHVGEKLLFFAQARSAA